jgi:hypothetical protein
VAESVVLSPPATGHEIRAKAKASYFRPLRNGGTGVLVPGIDSAALGAGQRVVRRA